MGGDGGVAVAQRAFIARVVVRDVVVPTAPQNANPFVRQGPERGMMGLAALALLVIEAARPVALREGVLGGVCGGKEDAGEDMTYIAVLAQLYQGQVKLLLGDGGVERHGDVHLARGDEVNDNARAKKP